MTFDEWFIRYPLPAEIDTMDDTDREQWTWAMRSAYKTGAESRQEWQGLTPSDFSLIEQLFGHKVANDFVFADIVCIIDQILKDKNT